MRRLCADREEKRVTRGSDISGQDGEQEQLDLNDPNQRSLLEGNQTMSDEILRALAPERIAPRADPRRASFYIPRLGGARGTIKGKLLPRRWV